MQNFNSLSSSNSFSHSFTHLLTTFSQGPTPAFSDAVLCINREPHFLQYFPFCEELHLGQMRFTSVSLLRQGIFYRQKELPAFSAKFFQGHVRCYIEANDISAS